MQLIKEGLAIMLGLLIIGSTSCKNNITDNTIRFRITNLSDGEYPDNPDIDYRATNYQNDFFTTGSIQLSNDSFIADFSFVAQNECFIQLKGINISEFIPTIASHIKTDEYLSYVSCINQEWNRNQVEFSRQEFTCTIPDIVRVDIARNCLNAYLWEVIVYVNENDKTVPYAHGWFDFPHGLYAALFEKKNNISYTKYKEQLENWVEPTYEYVNLDLLRHLVDTVDISYSDKSDNMYPVAGARMKKFKEIIYPESFETMRDLQTDSALFATFTPPGYYNKKDPRTIELGRIYTLNDIQVHKTINTINGDTLREVKLGFTHRDGSEKTQLVIGGLDFNKFPLLSEEDANKGWKNSMGIGNHSFYENYEEHLNCKASESVYYAMLLDENEHWLDSHKIGIDGPIFHFSDDKRSTLHLWLLSFERHAIVGHYVIQLK